MAPSLIAAICLLTFTQLAEGKYFNFHVIVKNTNNSFFDAIREGCDDSAKRISATLLDDEVKCVYTGPDHQNSTRQAEIMANIIANEPTSGIAISVSNSSMIKPLISQAAQADIPVVTFDSDAKESKRLAYIGTNQFAFGQELGKLLVQLAPNGGTYGLIADDPPNIQERVSGVRDRLSKSKWREIGSGKSPAYCDDDTIIALEKMAELAQEPSITAIISVGGWPMFNGTLWRDFATQYSKLKLVVGDSLPVQIDMMNKGFVNGLVGQLPYQMGQIVIDTLWNVTENRTIAQEIYGTTLLEIIRYPLVLPLLRLNTNNLGNVRIIGITFYTIIVLLSFGFLVWTWVQRNHRVVKASQPFFLIMICIGVFVMGSSIVPMGFDDESCNDVNEEKCYNALNVACMSVPWLFYLGMTTVYSALFSKLWRINIILAKAKKFAKVKIMPKDVLVPYALLITSNAIVLICWTVIDPLRYIRVDGNGTDEWNRVNSSRGKCDSEGSSTPYTYTLGSILIITLVLANVQAFRARKVHTELSESRFIAYIMVALLQVVIVGIPMFYLTIEDPVTHYALMVIIAFLMSILPLLLIFLPKIHFVVSEKRKNKDKAHVARYLFGKGQVHRGGVVQHHESMEEEEESSDSDEEDMDDDSGMIVGVIDTTAIAEKSISLHRSRRRIKAETRLSGSKENISTA